MPPQVYGDRWQVQSSLGEGGQAHTYLVVDRRGETTTQYVLKRLKNSNRLQRFRQEVDALMSFDNSNIVKIIDVDLDAEKPYFVTEFCSAGDLTKSQTALGSDFELVYSLFRDICVGLAAAHEKGIVHRDIKPENILLRSPDGPAVIADFGICFIEGGERHTLLEEQVGPRNFMSPEVEEGFMETIPPATDIYSLGKLLYWMISGGKTFPRERFRDDRYNLVEITRNPRLEIVNRLLDRMVTSELGKRAQNLDGILKEIWRIRHVLVHLYNVPSSRVTQRCIYCGLGVYKLFGNTNQADNFGLRNIGNPDWRIFTCSNCGNVQLFRLDMAGGKEMWNDRP